MCIGEFRLDLDLRSLYRGSERIKVSPKPFSTLEYLARNHHRVVPKAELLDAVWGGQREISTVEHAVSQLRRVFGDDAEKAQYIETLPGQGYRLVAEVHNPTPESGEVGLAIHSASVEHSNRRVLLSILAAVALLICVGAFAAIRHFGRQPRVARTVLSRNALAAMDAGGAVLWTYAFDTQLKEPPREESAWRTQIVDLNGDGVTEVLMTAQFETEDSIPKEELLCFSARGKLLWRYRPDNRFAFGSWEVNGPWVFSHVLVARENGSKRSVYLAVHHTPSWPSFVVRLSPAGTAKLVFVSSGNVRALRRFQMGSGSYILAAGINNEYRQASLAVLAENGPPSTSPQSEPTFQCARGCPVATPYRYILIPPSELSRASEMPYNYALHIVALPSGVSVLTDELGWDRGAIYEFSRELQPERVIWGDNYREIHRQFEREGRIKHTYENCPERSSPAILRVCDQDGKWSEVSVPRAFPPY
jgi:DNA-binding winged helix-turn-helix (wHTH) protein